ncbi:hypothetical protein BKA67DRAFT_568389 [Truncatella angustata]|uniref:Tetratricopeptide repeat protein n=1 Tax=Truncatella angustata TaxID=152316 RepID=A0A9P8ZWJ8_9PEZI|nr:uncharacterized protein BKA67DRAFT_568389 [Truncatella angustata]KAH6653027.1 hypothetical protein BKA67DRAFT_568389 [Truncatella angustata]KAH8199896.1 hypothetical protein TruAng_005952 [Truncatella angustata]
MTTEANNKPVAPKFEWDFDVPDTPFWQQLEFTVVRNFLTCYGPEEVENLHLDAALAVPDRLQYLLSQLSSDLSAREAAAAPQQLHVADPDVWRRFMLGIETLQKSLGLLVEEAQTIHKMLSTAEGNARVPWLNMLADLDLRRGDFVEAETVSREVLPWMQTHEKLGVDSPQAFGTTRIIIAAAWKQGGSKQDEARQLIQETFALIDGMGDSRFAKYQKEERQLLQELKAKLEAGK